MSLSGSDVEKIQTPGRSTPFLILLVRRVHSTDNTMKNDPNPSKPEIRLPRPVKESFPKKRSQAVADDEDLQRIRDEKRREKEDDDE